MSALGSGSLLIEDTPLERLDPALRETLTPVRTWSIGRHTYVLLDFGAPTGEGERDAPSGD